MGVEFGVCPSPSLTLNVCFYSILLGKTNNITLWQLIVVSKQCRFGGVIRNTLLK